jgi:hypothetical protein
MNGHYYRTNWIRTACWFFVCISFAANAHAAVSLKAAAAARVVNPTRPAVTIGHRVMKRFDNVYADLRVQAFVVEDADGKQIVWMGCDFCLVRAVVVDRIKSQIERRFGIPPEAVCINSSHTHSAPPLTVWEAVQPDHFDQKYSDRVIDEAVAVVGAAISRLQPARVRYVTDRCQVGINRRLGRSGSVRMLPNPDGVVDHRVQVVVAESVETGKLIGVAVKYACHPVTVVNLGLGSDYPGYMRKIFEERHPGAVAVFLQGCGGDVRIRVVNEDMTGWISGSFAAAERFGRELADAVDRSLESQGEPLTGPLNYAASEISLPVKVRSAEEYAAAASRNDAFTGTWGTKFSDMLEAGQSIPNEIPFRLQSFQFGRGDAAFNVVALDGEVLTEYGFKIEERLGTRDAIVLSYSNGVVSYIPTKQALLEGGYETTAYQWYRLPGPFDVKVEAMIVNEAVRLAKEEVD